MSTALIRLQKFFSMAGVCSRRRAEVLMQAGRVMVNGCVVREMGSRVDPLKDRVQLDGQPVVIDEKPVYIILNKPSGYVTSCKSAHDKTVLDLVDVPQRVFPVGRLDKQSTGLLLLTNDGRLHHRLSHPSFDHEKEYLVETQQPISDADLQRLARGVMILGRPTRRAGIQRKGPSRFRITLKEGRNRQIRRMVGAVGGSVKTIHRVRLTCLRLGDLAPGKYRFLTDRERDALLELARPGRTREKSGARAGR